MPSDEDVAVRTNSLSTYDALYKNAVTTLAVDGYWGISMFSWPNSTADEVIRHMRTFVTIGPGKMRSATIGALHGAGFGIRDPDPVTGHFNLTWGEVPPTDAIWDRLVTVLGPAQPIPPED